jgi:hypothetical protein
MYSVLQRVNYLRTDRTVTLLRTPYLASLSFRRAFRPSSLLAEELARLATGIGMALCIGIGIGIGIGAISGTEYVRSTEYGVRSIQLLIRFASYMTRVRRTP